MIRYFPYFFKEKNRGSFKFTIVKKSYKLCTLFVGIQAQKMNLDNPTACQTAFFALQDEMNDYYLISVLQSFPTCC